MANTQVGIYNYKQCIDIHIPSTGAQRICNALHWRLHDFEYASIIDRRFNHLLTNAMHSLVYWRDHPSRTIASFTVGAQRNIWNAYTMAFWDKTALRNAILQGDYIKYHLAEDLPVLDDNDFYRAHEQVCEQDSWCEGTTGEHTYHIPSPGWR